MRTSWQRVLAVLVGALAIGAAALVAPRARLSDEGWLLALAPALVAGLAMAGVALGLWRRLERAGEMLERQRHELDVMLDLMPVGVAISHDARGDRITVTPSFARVLGIEPGRNASCSAPDHAHFPYRCMRDGREMRADELPLQAACRRGVAIRDAEFDLVFPDGRVICLLVSAAPLFDAQGRVRGAIGTHVDITRLKQALRALEATDRLKNEFLATLAHELRGPVAPIRYAATVLKSNTSPSTIAQMSEMIERQAARLSHLLDDLLDLSRIARDDLQLKRVPLDLVRVMEDAVAAAQPALLASGHRLTVAACSGPLVVEADETRLAQIAGNLLDNAIKYTAEGGTVEVDVERAANHAVIRVRDEGVGIEAEDLPSVFEMFSRMRPGDDGAPGGLGIGLAVVKRLVALHGGAVEAYSAGRGRGSTFTVRLPLAADLPASAAPESQVVDFCRGGGRVLVVDDNIDAADTLAMLLRLHGLHVTAAYDGEAALELAERLRPTVIVLDVGLPRMSGDEVARAVRAREWGARVRIVGVTGWGQDEDRALTREAGFDAHLVKPVEPDELLRVLAANLRPDASAA